MGRKAKSVAEKTLDFLKSLGQDTSEIEGVLENVRDYTDLNVIQEHLYWQSNSNTTFLKKWSKTALFKQCDQCNRTFATNYHGVAYCSIACGAKMFAHTTKMPWEYTKKAYSKSLEERWGSYEPPMVVDPDFLETLEFVYLAIQKSRENPKTALNLPDRPNEKEPEDVFDFYLNEPPGTMRSIFDDEGLADFEFDLL